MSAFAALPRADQRAEILRLRQDENMTQEQVARHLGIGREKLRKRYWHLLPPHLQKRRRQQVHNGGSTYIDRALEMLEQEPGLMPLELANRLGCSSGTTQRAVERFRARNEPRGPACVRCEFPTDERNPLLPSGECLVCTLFYGGRNVRAWYEAHGQKVRALAVAAAVAAEGTPVK